MFEKSYNQAHINNELSEAVLSSNLEKVKELFASEHPPFVDMEINAVPIILHAAQRKDWKMVEELYNMEADLDARVQYLQWHLIHECVKNAPDRITKAVLDYCNINAQTRDGKTALMVAITENKLDMANYLVDLGRMDLSLCDKEQNNAAHYAAKAEQYELFIKLIQNKTPVNKENKEGKTPIDLIEDVTFRENLPRILGELAKIDKVKQVTIEGSDDNQVNQTEQVQEEPKKPKVSGLSSIKKK